jgi:hypothetical protein
MMVQARLPNAALALFVPFLTGEPGPGDFEEGP